MNAIADTAAAHPLGRVFGLSNEEYHAGPGVSKSQLDQIAESPATYIWAKNAPVDEEKLKAFDMGSAIHCLLLEPDEFKDRFIIAPPFNRRTNAGKAEEAEFLASSTYQRVLGILTGARGLLQPPTPDFMAQLHPQERAGIADFLAAAVIGGPATVQAGLAALLEATDADEMMLASDVYDPALRLRSLSLAAEAMGR